MNKISQEILPDFPDKSIIALKVLNANKYLAVEDLHANHGFDTGLALRDWCDHWEKFVLHKSENTISLQNMAGGFLSPLDKNKWTFRSHRSSWEKFDIHVKSDNGFTECIAISTQNLSGEFPLRKKYLSTDEGSDISAHEDEQYWEIILASPPAINVYSAVGVIDGSTTLKALSEPILNLIRKIVRAHKDIGFFHVIGHQVPLDLFTIFKNSVGILPWKDDKNLGDGQRKRHYGFIEKRPEKELQIIQNELGSDFVDGKILTDYFYNCKKLADTLLHMLALGQELKEGEPAAWREIFEKDAYLAVRGLAYHPGPKPEDDEVFLTTAQHTDATWITLLVEDGVGGLEIRSGSSCTKVPYLEGGIIVNTGNVLQENSGKMPFYKAVCHRVVRVSSSETRYSMPFFYDRVGSRTGGC